MKSIIKLFSQESSKNISAMKRIKISQLFELVFCLAGCTSEKTADVPDNHKGIRACVLLLALSVSCSSQEDNCRVLEVDTDAAKIIDLSNDTYPSVKFISEYAIGQIDQAVIYDTLALIKASGSLYGFNAETGDMIAKYSNRGRASNEYLTVWSSGVDSGRVFLYDINSKKIMYFSVSGELLYQTKVPEISMDAPFQEFVRAGDDRYVGKRVFGAGEIPELALYDENFRYLKDIGTMTLRSGAHFSTPFYRNEEGRVFYFRYMMNDIYLVDDKSVKEIYRIDFGRRNIPVSKDFKDEMQVIEYANEHPGKYATFVSNIYDSSSCFAFVYFMNGVRFYAVYDKATDHVSSYSFRKGNSVLSQISTYGDSVYLFWQDMSGATEMTIIPLSCLLS